MGELTMCTKNDKPNMLKMIWSREKSRKKDRVSFLTFACPSQRRKGVFPYNSTARLIHLPKACIQVSRKVVVQYYKKNVRSTEYTIHPSDSCVERDNIKKSHKIKRKKKWKPRESFFRRAFVIKKLVLCVCDSCGSDAASCPPPKMK